MTKQEYLSQVATLQRVIDKKTERVEAYRSLAESPASPKYENVGGSGQRSTEAPFVKWVYKIIELENDIKELRTRLDEIRESIIVAIEALENEDYKNLLVFRYLDGQPWEKVCEKMFISRWTAMRWHREALERLELPI